jgi:hypothetical protein
MKLVTSKTRRSGRALFPLVRSGRLTLRVVGSQKTGFRLGVEKTDNDNKPYLLVFKGDWNRFKRQTDAVQWGLDKLGHKARKLTKTKKAAKAA